MSTGQERLCGYPVVMLQSEEFLTEQEKKDLALVRSVEDRIMAGRRAEDQLGEIRATLKVNVERGTLPKVEFNEKQTTFTMLIMVLEKMINEREACKCGPDTTA